jgi:hypothetical protein
VFHPGLEMASTYARLSWGNRRRTAVIGKTTHLILWLRESHSCIHTGERKVTTRMLAGPLFSSGGRSEDSLGCVIYHFVGLSLHTQLSESDRMSSDSESSEALYESPLKGRNIRVFITIDRSIVLTVLRRNGYARDQARMAG